MAGRYQATLMTSGLKPILNKELNAALKRCSTQKPIQWQRNPRPNQTHTIHQNQKEGP